MVRSPVRVVNDEIQASARRRRAHAALFKRRNKCSLCRVTFNNPKQALAHFQGQKHLKNKELQGGPYRCVPCKLEFARKNEHAQHVDSKAHIRQLVKIEKAKK